MAVVRYSVGRNWKKAAAISVCEGIMLKITQLCASYATALPHCRYFLKKLPLPTF